MRTNGLDATSYVAIAELDPRLADVLLERLRTERIAAYAEPQQAPTGPLLDATPPVSPAERLYVDDAAAPRARELLAAQLSDTGSAAESNDPSGTGVGDPAEGTDTAVTSSPGFPEVDDTTWQQLVASFHHSGDAPIGRWPAQEDLVADEDRAADEASDQDRAADGASDQDRGPDSADDRPADDPAARSPSADAREPGEEPLDGTDDDAESDDRPGSRSAVLTAPGPTPASADERFVPPAPPPLPHMDPITKAAWLGLIGGPIVLILALVTDWYFPSWLRVGAAAAFALGFVVLVVRSRGGTVDDSDGTGAIV